MYRSTEAAGMSVHDEKMGKSASIQLKGVILATSSVPRPRVLLLILVQQAES